MKVCGSSSQTSWPAMLVLATKALKRASLDSLQPRSLARLSTSQKPALWRVCSYSGPGLPRPTIRRMGMVYSQIKKNPRPQKSMDEGFSVPQPHYCGGRLLLGFGGWLGISGRSSWSGSGFSGHVAGWYRSGGDGQVPPVRERSAGAPLYEWAEVHRVARVEVR